MSTNNFLKNENLGNSESNDTCVLNHPVGMIGISKLPRYSDEELSKFLIVEKVEVPSVNTIND